MAQACAQYQVRASEGAGFVAGGIEHAVVDISVVIPVLNEAARIGAVVRAALAVPEVAECVVVDGGSIDASVARARAAGARVCRADCGRAVQLDAGARAARGAALVFVHADTLLPVVVGAAMVRALRDRQVVGGSFRRRFVGAWSHLRWTAALGDLRVAWTGLSYGDQAQFVRRSIYLASGGYDPGMRCEDVDLARRLRRHGRLVQLGPPLRSSARRFRAHPWRTHVLDAWSLATCLAERGQRRMAA
ncbi:MAG: TIGR04283 family arsenosugar biosynthesis glycosyltransferase [Planctomycetota bacterium]